MVDEGVSFDIRLLSTPHRYSFFFDQAVSFGGRRLD
jgi:hypothetical protein